MTRATRSLSRFIYNDTPVYDPSQARALPYASMEVTFGIAPPSLVVLGAIQGPRLLWVTADRAILVTEQGRVVKTSGFGSDLVNSRALPTTTEGERRYVVDMDYRNLYGIEIVCRSFEDGPTPLEIQGQWIDARKQTEECQATEVDWRFTNEVWRDGKGAVWRAIEHFSPDLPPIEYAILKPAAQ